MITFEQARTITAAALLKNWNPERGTFYVADYGWENKDYWCMAVGSYEYLVDRNLEFQVDDDQLFLVEKTTGNFVTSTSVENLPFLDSLQIYGEIPTDFQ